MLPLLSAQGVALFAVSYDAVGVLDRFAAEHGIGFPLLSDAGSTVIRRLGLLNERVHEDHAAYGVAANPRHLGVPYPGVFLLDTEGVVVHKRFHPSYRERDTGVGLLASLLGMTGHGTGPEAEWRGEGVAIRSTLDGPTYCWFQRLRLEVTIVLGDGFAIQCRPLPEGGVPLSLAVAPIAGLEVGEVDWPDPPRLDLGGAGEACWGHRGTVRVSAPLIFTAPPGSGDQLVQVRLTYQLRHDSVRLAPSTARLELPVKEAALLGRSLPPSSEGARR